MGLLLHGHKINYQFENFPSHFHRNSSCGCQKETWDDFAKTRCWKEIDSNMKMHKCISFTRSSITTGGYSLSMAADFFKTIFNQCDAYFQSRKIFFLKQLLLMFHKILCASPNVLCNFHHQESCNVWRTGGALQYHEYPHSTISNIPL